MNEAIAPRPGHVPPELVRDFDFSDFPGHDRDVHAAWKRLHDGPDLFWSPRHGGYWVATRADDIDAMQADHERFSHRHITVPLRAEFPPLAPLEYDPPEHGPLRSVLSPAFGPKPVQSMEADLRRLSLGLLTQYEHRGHCDFVDAYAKRLPIVMFLRLVELPLEDREELLALTELSVRPKSEEDRQQAFLGLQRYMGRWIMERKARPGKDLLSRMVNAEIGGRPISELELAGMIPNVIFGGLDTVASALSFTARALAEDPALRRQLIDDPSLIPAAVEEFLRPGAPLARLEMRVFLEQWLEHIPDFHITPGESVRTSSGPVNGVLYLPLSWN